jgi:predicted nucleic acid-binding protein
VTILLDSTVLIDALRSKFRRRESLLKLISAEHELATSVINVAEIYAGMRDAERFEVEALLRPLLILNVTPEIAVRSGELRRTWRRKGVALALMDTLIAATALEHNFALMTSNATHFPMEELTLFPVPTIQ